MKRLIVLMLICIGWVGATQESFAQSTARSPYNGATHTYKFKGIANGLDYEFYVGDAATDVGIVNAIADQSFGTLVGDGDNNGVVNGLVALGEASVDITWAANASTQYGGVVYLFIRIFDADNPAICDNYKAVKITPIVNAFNVVLADASGATPSCPSLANLQPVIDVDGDGDDDYNSGTTTLTFTVTRESSANNWNFVFDIIPTNTTADFTYTIVGEVTPGLGAGDQTTVDDISINPLIVDSYATITIVVNNKPGENPSFQLKLDSAKDLTANISDLDVSDADKTHVLNIMPIIGDFEGI